MRDPIDPDWNQKFKASNGRRRFASAQKFASAQSSDEGHPGGFFGFLIGFLILWSPLLSVSISCQLRGSSLDADTTGSVTTGSVTTGSSPIPKSDTKDLTSPSTTELGQVRVIQSLYEAKKHSDLQKQAQEFLQKYPNSLLRAETQLLISRSLIEEKRWVEAVESLRQVQAFSPQPRSEFYAESVLELAKLRHLMGQNTEARAAVLEAQNLQDSLRSSSRRVQLPLVFGLILDRAGEKKKAREEFDRVLRGLNQEVGAREDLGSRKKRARVLLEISRQELPSLRREALLDFQHLQKFAIKSVEENDSEFSPQALDWWQQQAQSWKKSFSSPLADRSDLELFLSILQEAQSEVLVSPPGRESDKLKREISELLKNSQELLLSWSGPRELTPESKKRNREVLDGLRLESLKK